MCPEGDEKCLTHTLKHVGPVSVAIDASNPSFQFYKSGVYYEPNCSPQNLDHGVLAVGFGKENGDKYFLVKNSWSDQWVMVVTSKWLVAKKIIVELPPTQFTQLSPTQITNSNV